MDQTVLQILINAKDEASGALKGIGDTAKELGLGMAVAGGAITGALALTVNAAADAQKKMASFDATMQTMVGTTKTVVIGHQTLKTTVKETADQIAKADLAHRSAQISVQSHQAAIGNLDNQLKAHKITQAEYGLKISQNKLAIDKASASLGAHGAAIGKVHTAHVALTKQVTITAESMEAAKKQILAAADASLKLGFDNEESALSLAKLYQITGDVTEAVKLNAVAMDLARAKNIDMTTATTLVGQVLAGNGKALKQYGIDIKDSATPLEALSVLQGKIAGQAQAYANTFAGASEILKQQFGELEEQIGSVLLPVLTKLMASIVPLIQSLMDWMKANPKLTETIVSVLAILGPLLLAIPALGAAIAAIVSPVGLVIAAFGGLVTAAVVMGGNIDTITAKFGFFIPTLSQLKAWIDRMKATFVAATIEFEARTGIIKQLHDAFGEVWAMVQAQLMPAIQQLIEASKPLQPLFEALAKDTLVALVLGIKILIEVLKIGIELFIAVATRAAEVATVFLTVTKPAIALVAQALNGIGDAISYVIGRFNEMKAAAQAAFSAASSAVQSVPGVSQITSFAKSLPHFAQGGIVTGPTLAMVGEGGEPEAIIPFSKMGGMRGGITVNVTGNSIMAADANGVAKKIGDLLIKQLQQNARLAI
jgi:hypothetical protein